MKEFSSLFIRNVFIGFSRPFRKPGIANPHVPTPILHFLKTLVIPSAIFKPTIFLIAHLY